MKKETNPHNIHIGSIIKTKVTERGISDTELAKMIHCHSSTIHYLYKKESINTEQLWKISIALEYDFFSKIYGEKMPDTINRHNNEITTMMITTKKITMEKSNGIVKKTEYYKIPEK